MPCIDRPRQNPWLVFASIAALAGAALSSGCVVADEEGDDEADAVTNEEAFSAGVNGGACIKSPYNCKLRVHGGNAVENAQDGLWAVHDAPAVDGNGDLMAVNTMDHLRFNYGQTRRMNDVTYVFARSTSVGAAAWFPIKEVVSEDVLRDRVGEVNAKDTGGARLGCYEIRNSHDADLVEKKVVFDSTSTHERAGDYLPLPRNNGVRYANLAFSVPGFGLGAPAIDIYPAGSHFQRIDVPTSSHRPSITINLYVKDAEGRYRTKSGTMKFIYGYIHSKLGTHRYGWMALPALSVSSGCT